ncbi:outer membrane protein assembly factor BamC [Alcaligenes faecalis]|uniref:outer membrane protein assembly factor BamC n=1 Tax=Alcaligenes faecalis TaxID=511 RepID=UPI0005AA4CE8|nr:outer membrane protein assembly factor BamC [Alcaligenes faecalis]ATH98835.1 outer membrane protein assembly factor BamC [Alcaligenes faecalis]AYZ91620.1 outer membrane protein assembly factor BamC [Alcaligenes faecalis]MCX5594195.1 outer membrane protein assembly factor BamC [Alcaligenes faecalis]QQC32559.1 outer membrane protein assembly factor BamC [Alcaligenes faecalis]CAJ0897392.1 outer membrane protein assembly factor BamC [Alcaligenes faecalis subsp. faecalis]
MIAKPVNKSLIGLSLSLLVLSGCSTMDQIMGQGESVNYKSTVAGDPLSIPPDLTQANRDAHYRAPEGATSYSVYSQGQNAQQVKGGADDILPQSDAIKVMRDGDLRWLVVDRPVEDLFPRIIEFWGDHGFTIQSQDPRAGLIQTDWAENRAKIPESWIRSALGSIIDQVFDSGERDRFRTRFERVGDKTEIYVSHQHMEETPTADGAAFKWVFAKEDPGLNAAMLARMMVFLGSDIETAREQVANATKDPAGVQVQASDKGDQAELMLNESFDRAWRRVGVAIDSAGFSVEDRDRSAGEFFIRYLDSDTGEKIEQQNIIGRIFGSRNTAEATPFRIKLSAQGAGTRVTVLDQQGQEQTTATAKRIINVLSTNLRPGN